MSGDSGDDPVPMVRKAIGRRDSHSYISVTFQTDLSNEFKKESYSSLPREPLGRSLPKEISQKDATHRLATQCTWALHQ